MKKPKRTPRCTEAQRDARVEYLAKLMAQGKTKTEMHAAMRQKFDLHWTSTDETYIPRARQFLRERANMTPEDARGVGLALLDEALRRAKTARDIVAVEKRRGEIFGYDSPQKHELTGAAGGPLQTEAIDSPVSPRRLRELAERAERQGRENNGHGPVKCARCGGAANWDSEAQEWFCEADSLAAKQRGATPCGWRGE